MSLDNVAGGLERQILRTADCLQRSGFRVFLISFDSPTASAFYELPKDVTWLKCGRNLSPHEGASLIKRILQIYYFRKIINSHLIDCLITFNHGLYFRSFLATLFTGVRNIVSERNSLSLYKYVSLNKLNPSLITSFFASARTVQLDAYRAEYPRFTQHKVYTIPNILSKPSSPLSKPCLHSRTVCMLGRLEAQKNFLPLLDQMSANINELSFRVIIGGDGSLRPLIQRNYSSLIASHKLVLLGNIANIYDFFSQCSLFCFPSLWEGYPNSLVEALAAGLPIVISNRLSHLTDFVEQSYNGEFVNDQMLYQTISRLISNSSLLQQYSNNSLKIYSALASQKPEYLWPNLVNNVLNL